MTDCPPGMIASRVSPRHETRARSSLYFLQLICGRTYFRSGRSARVYLLSSAYLRLYSHIPITCFKNHAHLGTVLLLPFNFGESIGAKVAREIGCQVRSDTASEYRVRLDIGPEMARAIKMTGNNFICRYHRSLFPAASATSFCIL